MGTWSRDQHHGGSSLAPLSAAKCAPRNASSAGKMAGVSLREWLDGENLGAYAESLAESGIGSLQQLIGLNDSERERICLVSVTPPPAPLRRGRVEWPPHGRDRQLGSLAYTAASFLWT